MLHRKLSDGWSRTETLLARLIDEQAHGNWMYLATHTKKRPPLPKPVRSADVTDRRRPASVDEMKRFFGAVRFVPKGGE